MYLDLNSGNQENIILKPKKDSKWIDKTIKKFPWDKYDVYDNRLNEYMQYLFDTLSGNNDDDDNDDEDDDKAEEFFWENLTKGQKYFYTYLVFEGEVDNGGLFQFFWNRPEHAYSFLNVIEILKQDRLKHDYLIGLKKYENIKGELTKLREQVNPNNENIEEEYYNAYIKGLNLFGEEDIIEEYFYDEEFQKEFHKSMCDFIENNRRYFVKE